ncbi:GatB/YqeY domain-containing protein [bacterium]|nr:GatB/YqeY domain-containing protein [bacterium]
MNLKEKIKMDLKQALKEKREEEFSTLRFLLATILNKEKEKRARIAREKKELNEKRLSEESQLKDEEIIQVILSEIKKRKEAILSYEKGKREDLINKEKRELEILKRYLPKQMSDEEIERLVRETIKKLGVQSLKDIGKVMGNIMPKIKGKAEGARVSQIVKRLLSSE